ncbi:hypothetical protein OG455_19215 [Kitasatospora sp. NBC_01287]|uniref:hypothetical protein n=1 Tax=Kitasatospora sp. NBC_01287 TaxID=2903573 RepID=UPI00225BFB70|nr:hypothetical protein [Kitasatospora sp. NBC_01287]MCX4747621.1 hypothetical protein [Kitasatospora sp. NBC_01287]
MQILGFYQEFWPAEAGEPVGRLTDLVGGDPLPDEAAITAYLRDGSELFSAMGSLRDVLGSDYRILGGDSLFTDGEWVWRGDLWFYLQTYHAALPGEFVARVRELGHQVPEVSRERLIEVWGQVRTFL